MTSTSAGDPAAAGEYLHTAPRDDHTEATLAFTRGVSDLHIEPEHKPDRLFSARFTGRQPAVAAAHGTVNVRYPVGLNLRTGGDVALSPDVMWTIRIRGGADGVHADLSQVGLHAIDIDGGASQVTLRLPSAGATVPIHIGGGVTRVMILRPTGVAARLSVSRGAADLVFDEQHFGALGGEIELESPPMTGGAGRYDITIGSGASHLTIAST